MADASSSPQFSDVRASLERDQSDAPTRPPKRQGLTKLAENTQNASKRVLQRLDVIDSTNSDMDADGRHLEGVTDNPVFDTSRVYQRHPYQSGHDLASRTLHSVQSAVKAVTHPKDAAKKKATTKIPADDRPFLSVEEDRQIIDAHHFLQLSKSSSTRSPSPVDEDTVNSKIGTVLKLQGHREEMETAWITSKHVKRARAVRSGQIPCPNIENYREVVPSTGYVVFRWERYLGHVLLYLSEDFGAQYVDDKNAHSFKRGTLLHHAERFFIATSPWQSYLMQVRKVYLWEDVYLTGRWFLIFLLLLKTGYIMTFFYFYIAYIVLRNRYFPMSPDALKEAHQRAMDRGKRVHNLSELIIRHGNDQWLDPLLDELGPLLQQQLGDLADYLEILVNFYNWQNPRATAYTVVFWITCGTLAALTSAQFGEKVLFWVAGFYFFGSRPIASRFPKYRHLVSIFRWIYWDVPTHAEMAFQKLQMQAQRSRHIIMAEGAKNKSAQRDSYLEPNAGTTTFASINNKEPGAITTSEIREDFPASSDTSSEDESDESVNAPLEFHILSFRGRCRGHAGRLNISSTGVKFVRSNNDGARGSWSRTFREMVEISKSKTRLPSQSTIVHKIGKRLVPMEALTFQWTDGTEENVEAMRKRDEAFNTIIGFSGIRWQILPGRYDDEEMVPYDGDEKQLENGEGKGRRGKVSSELGKI